MFVCHQSFVGTKSLAKVVEPLNPNMMKKHVEENPVFTGFPNNSRERKISRSHRKPRPWNQPSMTHPKRICWGYKAIKSAEGGHWGIVGEGQMASHRKWLSLKKNAELLKTFSRKHTTMKRESDAVCSKAHQRAMTTPCPKPANYNTHNKHQWIERNFRWPWTSCPCRVEHLSSCWGVSPHLWATPPSRVLCPWHIVAYRWWSR